MKKEQREEKNITEDTGDEDFIIGVCMLIGTVILSIATGIEISKHVDSVYLIILMTIAGALVGAMIGTFIGCFIAPYFCES